MKKILATLLVATMLLSCMTFVSFAAASEAYTIATAPAFDISISRGNYKDAFTKSYFEYVYNATWSDAIEDYTSPFAAALDAVKLGTAAAVPATYVPGDYVAIPVYCEDPGATVVGVKADYDAELLVPVEDPAVCGSTVAEVKDGQFVVSKTNANPVAGLHYALYFTIKDGAVGDVDGNATTTVTLNWQNADNEFVEGNNVCAVKLSGLEKGQPAVQDKDITAEELAEVVTYKALSEDADAAGLADALANYSGVEVPSDVATNKYVYNAIFATIPTEGYNTPSEYGVILHTAAGDQKAPAKITANGKFGIFVYGSSYALDGIESYQLYCVVNGETVLGEVVAY